MRDDPFHAHRFRVEIDFIGVGALAFRAEAACAACDGLRVDTQVFDYAEGGRNDYLHHLYGPTRYPPLVLRRGLTSSEAFWNWYADTAAGRITRRDGVVWLLGDDGQEVMRWDIFGAFPVRWTGPDLRADAANVTFEALELVHRGFNMARVG